MSTVIEKVRQQEHLRESASEAAYQQLVRDSHAGVEVDPRNALEILEAAGRDSADLEEDCKLLDARAECQRLANEIPTIRAKLDQNRGTLAAAKAALAAAEREARGIAERIQAENDRLVRRMNECQRAANRLRNDAAVRDEENWSARQQLAGQRGALSDAIRRAELMAAPSQIAADKQSERRRLEEEYDEARRRPQYAKRSKEAVQAELDVLDQKYQARIERRDQLRKQCAELEAEERRLEAQAITS